VRGRRLPRSFFEAPTELLARELLGRVLVRREPGGLVAGRIVETEAYLADKDPASHSHRGETERNRSMFGRPGTAYVYLIYGMHHCLNVVSAEEGRGEAVLIRALEPLEGQERMRERRGGVADRDLCRGPGRLAQALGLTREHDGLDLCRGELGLWSGGAERPAVVATPRVGIRLAAELPLRFVVAGSRWASGPRPPGA
jgi:DNA-3-methyladenine glycosylase